MKVAVIGAGPGGYVAALKAAQMGADVTLFEKSRVGGTCLNIGCIPTKSLLASAEVLETVKHAQDFGVEVAGTVAANVPAMMMRKDKILNTIVKGVEQLCDAGKVKRVYGHASFLDTHTLRVDTQDGAQDISFDKIVIATGSKVTMPEMYPFDGEIIITSDEALSLKDAPKSMIIMGGGVIAVEFGQFFRRMGTEIHMIMRSTIISQEDEDISKHLMRTLKKEKIKFYPQDGIRAVNKNEDGVTVTTTSGKTLTADKLLVCIGRSPYTEGLELQKADIVLEERTGTIPVNEFMQTSHKDIYAIGDVVASAQLAHVASREAAIAIEHALTGKSDPMSYKAVPRCVYTDPEVASVGKTEKQLKKEGISYKTGSFDFRALGKAMAIGNTQGTVKILVDDNDVIIGAAVTGAHATDLLAELTLAVELGLTAQQVGSIIHPHPTLSEALMEALHDVHKQSVHKVYSE